MRSVSLTKTIRRAGAIGVALLASTGLTLVVSSTHASAATTTATITPGNDVQVLEVTSPGRPVCAEFSGKVHQIPTVEVVEDTFAHPVTLALLAPGGRTASSFTVTAPVFRSLPPLTSSGRWTVLLKPARGDTGRLAFMLTYAAAPAMTLSGSGDGTVSLPRPGEVQEFHFAGVLGAHPTMTGSAVNWTSASSGGLSGVSAQMYRPDGTAVGIFHLGGSGELAGRWMEMMPEYEVIDRPGTWRLVFRGVPDTIGSQSFHLGLVMDQQLTIQPGEQTVVSVQEKAQNVRYSFHGVTGQRPTIDEFSRHWLNPAYATVRLLRPDGSEFDGCASWERPMPQTAWCELSPLDVTGEWTLILDPDQGTTGSETLVLGLVTDPVAVPLATGTPIEVSLPQAGTNQDFTFSGTPGMRLMLDVSASSWTSLSAGGAPGSGTVKAALYGPDGEWASAVSLPASGSGLFELPKGPPTAGTWRLRFDPGADSVGSLTVSVSIVTDVSGSIEFGQPVTVNLDQPYEQGRFAFSSGSGSGTLYATVQGSTFDNLTLRFLDSYDQVCGSAQLTAPGDGEVSLGYLYVPTTYVLVVDPEGTTTGSLTITLTAR